MADEIAVLTARAIQAEAEINMLEAEIAQLQDPKKLLANGIISPELEALRAENAKLNFQIGHLERNISKEEKKCVESMISIGQMVSDVFGLAIRQAYPDVEDATVLIQKGKFADYQCNSAMNICQKLKAMGIKCSPQDVAKKIIEQIPEVDFFEKLEVAGPGYINVYLKKTFVAEQIHKILKIGVRPPSLSVKRRVVIDFSSPNIAKEMHVGHLRSTIIGESISRLLEWVGHDVLRINHLGDWGTQFGMLIAHLQDKFPDYYTVSPPIQDLQAFYKESKVRFDEDAEFKKRAYNAVVQLQKYEEKHLKAWNLICDVSRNEFQKVYDRLGVSIIPRGESFYQDLMPKVVQKLDDNGFTEMDDGRKIMFLEGEKVPLTLVKSDGGFTYDTSDMAAIHQRLFDEKGEWLIYVVDAGQGPHFDLIYAAAQKAGWYNPKLTRVEHVAFGVVLGEDKFYQLTHEVCAQDAYTTDNVQFEWDMPHPVTIMSDLTLPQFEPKPGAVLENCSDHYGKFACLQTTIKLERKVGYYVVQVFIPSILIVVLSWVSFWVDHDAVPARISLGVLTVLTMTTQSSGSRQSLPQVSYVKAIDVWMSTCLLFVFVALLEYSYVNVLARRKFKTKEEKKKTPVELQQLTTDDCSSREFDGDMVCSFRRCGPECALAARKVDKISRVVFPSIFILFNIAFWTYYTLVPHPE